MQLGFSRFGHAHTAQNNLVVDVRTHRTLCFHSADDRLARAERLGQRIVHIIGSVVLLDIGRPGRRDRFAARGRRFHFIHRVAQGRRPFGPVRIFKRCVSVQLLPLVVDANCVQFIRSVEVLPQSACRSIVRAARLIVKDGRIVHGDQSIILFLSAPAGHHIGPVWHFPCPHCLGMHREAPPRAPSPLQEKCQKFSCS